MNLDKSFNDFVEVIKLSFKGFFFDNEAIEKAKKIIEIRQMTIYNFILILVLSPLTFFAYSNNFGFMGSFYYVIGSLALTIPFIFLISCLFSFLLKIITKSDIYTTFKAILFYNCSAIFLVTSLELLNSFNSPVVLIVGGVLLGVLFVLSVVFFCRVMSIFYNVSAIKVFLIFLLYLFIFFLLFFLVFFIGIYFLIGSLSNKHLIGGLI